MSTEASAATTTAPISLGFVRKATGLVRQAGALDVFIYNVNFINIAIGVAFIFLFIPAGAYPGSNVYLAIVLTTLAVIPTNLVYGMLASTMPRSGGEYVYVSRTLGPIWGLAANWNYTVWSFFYIGVPAAFLGKYGISSLMRTIGVYSGQPGLVNVGAFFGPLITGYLAQSDAFRALIEEVHAVSSYVLLALVVVHFAGALNHHFWQKNDVLRRMGWRR